MPPLYHNKPKALSTLTATITKKYNMILFNLICCVHHYVISLRDIDLDVVYVCVRVCVFLEHCVLAGLAEAHESYAESYA